jgi:transposase
MKTALQTRFNDDSFYTFDKEKNIVKVYYGTELLMAVDTLDTNELKRAIIYFRNIDVSENWLSRTFSIARSTINNWYRIFIDKGIDALMDYRKGPRKINSDIQAYVVAAFKDLGFCRGYKNSICDKVREHFGITIHWRSVSDILIKNGIDLSTNSSNRSDRKRNEDERSCAEIVCRHAGLFLIFPYLQKLEIERIFSKAKPLFKNAYYGVMEYIYGYFLLYTSNMIEVEENIKMHQEKKIELVVGEKGLPSLRSYRKHVPQIIKAINIEELEYELAKKYYNDNKDCSELYIDGHFMPYNGKYNTFKGYNPIRRFVQKGRAGYFINNSIGRPFFYILSDGYKDFREYLGEIAHKIGRKGAKNSNKQFILVFDRGGWGKEFCKDIGKEIIFICWRTGKIKPPKDAKWIEVEIEKQGNEYGHNEYEKLEAAEEIKTAKTGNYVERNIFIKRGDKISLAFTNDKRRGLKELVKILTKRWGVQENIFKGLKRIGIDKISSYKNQSYPEDWLLEEGRERKVVNPQKKIVVEKITTLKTEIKKLKEKIGSAYLSSKNKKTKLIAGIEKIINEKYREISQLRARLSNIPDRIDIQEIIKTQNIVRLNSEKKNFLDLIKVMSYNVQQDIVDEIRPIYKNERDVNMFVRELLDRDGVVKMRKDKIDISFDKFNSRIKNRTIDFLIQELNKMKIKHPLLESQMQFSCH